MDLIKALLERSGWSKPAAEPPTKAFAKLAAHDKAAVLARLQRCDKLMTKLQIATEKVDKKIGQLEGMALVAESQMVIDALNSRDARRDQLMRRKQRVLLVQDALWEKAWQFDPDYKIGQIKGRIIRVNSLKEQLDNG